MITTMRISAAAPATDPAMIATESSSVVRRPPVLTSDVAGVEVVVVGVSEVETSVGATVQNACNSYVISIKSDMQSLC